MRTLLLTSLVLLAVGCGHSTDEWLQQLKNPDVVKRRQAIRELGSRNGDAERVVAALTDALQDDSGYVRRDAAVTLGKFGPAAKPAASILVRLLKDKEVAVRKAAAASLRKITPEESAKYDDSSSSRDKNDRRTKMK